MALLALVSCGAGDRQAIRDVVIVGPDGQTTAISLPARLDRAGLVPARPCRYQVLAHVELEPALVGHELVLVLPSLSARASATADGEPLAAVRGGATGGYRQRPPLAWSVPARLTDDGGLDVTFEVDHTWTQSAWLTAEPELVIAGGGLGSGTWVERVNLPFAAAGLAVVVCIGLVMAWLYLIDRSRLASRLLAIQALSAAVYPAHVVGLLIPLGRFEVPVVLTGLTIAITAGVYYTRLFLDLPPPSRWWLRAAAIAIAVYWLSTDPFRATDVGVPVLVVYLSVTLCVLLHAIIQVIRIRRDRESWLYLLPWLSLAAAAPPDLLSFVGLAEPLDGARTGVIAFVLFPLLLELLLNEQHVGSLRRANLQLATKVSDLETHRVEIEDLNDELRRQISDRAAQIHAALLLARGRQGSAPELAAGELVQGRYRVDRAIGAGGMGTVYEVTRLVDGRRLALKLAREISVDALARMAREAHTAATVDNPHVVAMLDVDVASAGYLFLIMELVDGEPLSSQRERYGDRRWALEVLAQIADGLAAMHRVGVIHRDLKPGNVLLTRGKDQTLQIKITDFGLSVPEHEGETQAAASGARDLDAERRSGSDAGGPPALAMAAPSSPEVTRELSNSQATAETRVPPAAPVLPDRSDDAAPPRGKHGSASDGGSPALTRTGFITGTPAYMAPELAEGRHRLVVAADVFAFGVIARELLVGVRPFGEPTVLARLDGRTPRPAASLAEAWPDAPADLISLLDACLDFEPAARPSAARLAEALSGWTASDALGAPAASPTT